MAEWICFFITAALLMIALVCFAVETLGAYRLGFVMNRMHAGGIGDTLGLFAVICALAVSGGAGLDTLKLFLIVVFMWFTSPVSTHFLGQVEYHTNEMLYRFTDRSAPGEAKGDERG